MARKFRLNFVDKEDAEYDIAMRDYVGMVMDYHPHTDPTTRLVALYTPNKDDYWYYDKSWLTEVFEDGREEKKSSPLDKQVSGTHYKDCGIQPIEYIHANGLNYFEGNAVKYITRHRKKNGKADIEKAIHYLELMLELEYKEDK